MEKKIEMTAENEAAQVYDRSTHRVGRAWTALMLLVMLSVPFVVCVIFGTVPNLSPEFWAAFIPILMVNIPSCLVEVAVYSPLLGTGGNVPGLHHGQPLQS